MLGDNSPALIPELCATLTATHLTSRQCGFAPPGKAAPAYTRGDYDPRQRPLPDREPSTNFKALKAGTGVSARLSSHMGNLSMAEIPGPSLEFGQKKLEINKRLENVFLKIVSQNNSTSPESKDLDIIRLAVPGRG
jgi:hypothetical protein